MGSVPLAYAPAAVHPKSVVLRTRDADRLMGGDREEGEREEVIAIQVIAEDGAAFDPAPHDVVEGVWGIQVRAAGHSPPYVGSCSVIA